jgi:predicted dehydrogenase
MPRSSTSPTLIAVIGCGAFGRNHARVYHELQKQGEPIKLVGVVDADIARAENVASQNGTKAYPDIRELLAAEEVHAASVAVPTVHHLAVARELLTGGVDVLIEKPLATTLAEADELIALARKHNRVAQVGHLERFNPGVRATVPLVTQPMFFEVHRLSLFSPRALDVDVVLDLMIHDLDIVLSFVNSPVREVRAVGLPILSSKVDIASVRMEFESGCVANLTASRVSTEKIRKLRFFQPHQYISIDYTRQDVLAISVKPPSGGEPAAAPAPEIRTGAFSVENLARIASGDHPLPPQFAIQKPPIEKEEPLHAELRSFLHAVRRTEAPVVTLEDGRRALAVALDILAQIDEHSRRAQLRNLHQ